MEQDYNCLIRKIIFTHKNSREIVQATQAMQKKHVLVSLDKDNT